MGKGFVLPKFYSSEILGLHPSSCCRELQKDELVSEQMGYGLSHMAVFSRASKILQVKGI